MRFIRLVGAVLSGIAGRPSFSGRTGVRAFTRGRRFPDLQFRLPALAVVAFVLTLAWFVLLSFYANVVDAGYQLPRRPDVVFFAAALLGWLVLFFAALPAARALFLDRGENELFLSLPIRPARASLARFIVLWLCLIPVELFVFLPAFASYRRHETLSGSVITGCAVSVLIVPLFPAALALGLALGLRRVLRYSRRTVAVEIAAVALLLALLAALQAAFQHSLAGVQRLEGLIFQEEAAILIGRLMDAVPPAAWFASAFRPGGGAAALASIVFGASFAAAAVWLAARSFPAESGVARRPRGAHVGAAKPPAIPGSALVSLVGRETAVFLARPGLAAETALRLLALPVFLVLYAAAGPREVSAALSGFISSSPGAALAAIGFLLFVADVSFLAGGAVSREGRSLGVSLTLPVSGARQVKAKFVFLLLLSLPPAGLALALVYALFPLPAETLVCAAPGVAAYFVLSIAVGLFLDLRRPAPARAVPPFRRADSFRPTSSTVLASAAGAAALCALGLLAAGMLAAGMSPLAAGFFVVTILTAADLVIVPRLFRYADRRYAGELEA